MIRINVKDSKPKDELTVVQSMSHSGEEEEDFLRNLSDKKAYPEEAL